MMEAMSRPPVGGEREAADRKLTSKIELNRAASVVAAILLDHELTKGNWPSDTDLIKGIKIVLFLANESDDVEEMLRSRDQLLSKWLTDYLEAIRPRLLLLPFGVTAQEILDLGKKISHKFAEFVEAIKRDPNHFIRDPQTIDEWIDASAYAYLQMHDRNRLRDNLQRSEFEGVEPLENGE